MTLRFVPLDEQGKDISKSRYLFETAFLAEERPPFSAVLAMDHRLFFGVYEGERFIGFTYLIEFEDILYVFFLAVSKRYRNKGYGTGILNEIKARYPSHRLFLLADEVGEHYPDNEIRKRRIAFYARNGFVDSGTIITEYGVRYHLLTFGGAKVSEADFYRTMRSLIGEEWAKKLYPDLQKLSRYTSK